MLHFARRVGWFLQSHFPSRGGWCYLTSAHLVTPDWLALHSVSWRTKVQLSLSWFGYVWLKRKCLHLGPIVLFLTLSMNFPQKLSDHPLQLGYCEGVG